MSDSEKFLSRWSRRKREAVEDREATASPLPPTQAAPDARAGTADVAQGETPARPAGASDLSELPFDVTRLPPLESITAATDIRAFLAPGVPADLTRAALRRAWTTDPKIRDFVGLADYDWDYHAPGSMAGFGPLEMTDELRRLVARIVGGDSPEEVAARDDPTPAAEAGTQTSIESIPTVASTADPPIADCKGDIGISQDEPVDHNQDARSHNDLMQCDQEYIASQQNVEKSEDLQTSVKRSHGRALPK
jgi:hypothetical protein